MTPTVPACPCGGTEYEQGFIDDAVNGRVRWIQGPLVLGLFGNAKRSGPKRPVLAMRCTACSRLELVAGDPV
jgi:hypothetical protein